jgi:hypothetical protein
VYDAFNSQRVTGLVTATEAVKIDKGVVHKQSSTKGALDVLKQIDDWHVAKKGKYGTPKGLECTITHAVHPPKSGSDAGGNIFAGTTFPHANFRCEGKDDQPSWANEGEGAGSQKMNEWLSKNIPELTTKDELALYGYAKVKNETFVLKSPIGFWPIIPVFVGEKYHKNVRGGMYIERVRCIAAACSHTHSLLHSRTCMWLCVLCVAPTLQHTVHICTPKNPTHTSS